jgi:glucokinase
MILAGDVGGTKCNLAVFDDRTGTLLPIFQRRMESRTYPEFESVVSDFDGTFLRSFREKAVLENVLAQIPLYVVVNQLLPVLGAAARAAAAVGV